MKVGGDLQGWEKVKSWMAFIVFLVVGISLFLLLLPVMGAIFSFLLTGAVVLGIAFVCIMVFVTVCRALFGGPSDRY